MSVQIYYPIFLKTFVDKQSTPITFCMGQILKSVVARSVAKKQSSDLKMLMILSHFIKILSIRIYLLNQSLCPVLKFFSRAIALLMTSINSYICTQNIDLSINQ